MRFQIAIAQHPMYFLIREDLSARKGRLPGGQRILRDILKEFAKTLLFSRNILN